MNKLVHQAGPKNESEMKHESEMQFEVTSENLRNLKKDLRNVSKNRETVSKLE